MRMRAVDTLALPAGKTVELKPGGYHVMLMDLAQPLQGRRNGADDAHVRGQGKGRQDHAGGQGARSGR